MPAPILLLAFRYPPFNRIGAYRWSKLSGRLARLGHEIDVLCAPWPAAEDPGWFRDVEHERIRIHRVHSSYPHQLRSAQPEHRFLQKAHGKIFRWLDRLTPPHDIASLWGLRLRPAAELALASYASRPVMIATGAPFSANYWAARIKQRHPDIKLIQDFRDPWLTSEAEFSSSPWARRFRTATREANLLVSVTPEMTALFQRLSGHARVATVPNGVDLSGIRGALAGAVERFDFAYTGNLYNGREEPLAAFLSWIRQKREASAGPRVVIAGTYPSRLGDTHRDLIESGNLSLEPHLPQARAFELLASSRIALHLNGPGALATFQTTTKLVEHAALGRPTLSVNYGGATHDFIRSRHLGWSLRADSASLFAELDACLAAPRDFDFDVSDFDFDSTARLYSALIDELAKA